MSRLPSHLLRASPLAPLVVPLFVALQVALQPTVAGGAADAHAARPAAVEPAGGGLQEPGHGATAEAGHEATAAAGHGEEFDIQEYIGHHLSDSRELDFAPFGAVHLPEIHVGPLDLSITKHVVFLWLAAALMLAIFLPMARSRSSVHKGLFNFMEALVVYVRDQVAVANIGKEKAGPFVPYLLTLFFFILFANLLGLLPYGATATSNWMVTGALAVLTLVVAEGSSLRHLGPRGYVRQFLPIHMDSKSIVGKLLGLVLVGLIFIIEVISHISRIIALMVRLAANMTAGHLLIFALLGMIFLFRSFFVAPASVGFSVAVYLLEIFIALLQAYIFTLLTALFVGMAVHEHH